MLSGRSVIEETLERRRTLLEAKVLPRLGEPVRYSPELKAEQPDLIASARDQRMEGLIAKRRDSPYEPGLRSGAWQKMRLNQGQEFVIGGYTPSATNFDALVIGYYEGRRLLYAARTRNSFTPGSRAELFRRLRPLELRFLLSCRGTSVRVHLKVFVAGFTAFVPGRPIATN